MDWPFKPRKRGIPSEKPVAHVVLAPRALTPRNTSPHSAAPRRHTPQLFAILALLVSFTRAHAQDFPAPDAAMAAFQSVEQWIRDWNVPEASQLIDPPNARAAQVTLRLAGKVIGRASLVSDDRTTLWHAARAAWREAEANLDIEKDALRETRVKETAQRVTIDIEVAGPFVPLLGATWADAAERISPGLQGVAARVGDDIQGVFPGEMIATGTLPGRALQICAGRLRLPPLELGQLRENQSLSVYWFRTLHLAQLKPGAEPTFLTRGGKIAPDSETSGPGLRALADRIARHLVTHQWPGEEPHGMMGNYLPLTDSYDPILAPPREQGIVAFALARYAATPGVDPDMASHALSFARSIVNSLAVVTKDETDPLASPIDAAAWLIAHDAVTSADKTTQRPQSDFALRATATISSLWRDPNAWTATPVAARAFIVYAFARVAASTPDASDVRAAATEGVRGIYRSTEPAELVSLMPWLGWAELTLAEGQQDVPSADALRAMRNGLWQNQLQSADTGDFERDLEGGIVFSRGTTPLPTWQSLRPLAFIASMIGDPRLTPTAELTSEIAALRRSLRFVRQLSMDDASAWAARNPAKAIGGVRPALWTPQLSLDASALALASISETLQSISRRAAASTPPKGPMGRPQPELPPAPGR